MHAILNVAEVLLTEHMDDEQLTRFYRDTYGPETVDGAPVATPAGFTPDDELAAFDAFSKMAGDG